MTTKTFNDDQKIKLTKIINNTWKKIIMMLFATYSTVWAQTVIPIIWPYNPGSQQANYIRAIVDDANNQQQKYKFIFEHKPGAGSSIAMQHALNSNTPMIVSNSSTIFIRPMFHPNESFDVNNFVPIVGQMTLQPVVIFSQKFSSMSELRNQSKLSIGVVPGTLNDLVAKTLAKNLPGVDVVYVPYAGSPEIRTQVLGGHLDLGIEFPADIQQFILDKKLNVIGITGKKTYPNFPTFASQGHVDFEFLVNNYFFVTSKNISVTMRQELHDILAKSNKNAKVTKLYQQDFAVPSDNTLQQTDDFFQSLKNNWPRIFDALQKK
jgi:tripartite-type tricarboxylate transporter receptor subunit TctC